MQQKYRDAGQIAENDAEELRSQLQLLLRHLESFDDYETANGNPLPNSYAQALMVLLGFHHEDTSPTLSDLVELLNIDKSNVTRLCQRMRDAGHIDIVRDQRDRRAKRISLSSEGLALAQHVNASSVERFGTLIGSMHDAEKQRVLDSLILLNEVIERLDRKSVV